MQERRKLKITYIMPDFDENAYSSGLYVMFQHCNGLIERGHEVRVFNNFGKKSRYLQLDCPVGLHKNDPSIVERNAPDIIVGTYWHTYFFVNRMKDIIKNNTKLCFLIQSNDMAIYSDEDRQLISKIMVTKYRNIIPIHKIVISQYLKEMVAAEFGQEAFYIRNGFEPREVTPLLPESENMRIAARYDPSTFRGWDLVDKVLNKLMQERKDIEIHLFEMKDKKPARYKNYFHKGLTGDNLLGLFKSCAIYLSGSRYEGFSYPVLEAMSQGACVCCTDAGGNRDFCIDGQTALMSGRDDAESLYRNLLRLLDDKDLRARIRANGIKKAKDFPWKDSLDSLDKLFLSLAAQGYEKSAAEMIDVEEKPSAYKGKALFIYTKDPFVKYENWQEIEESVRSLKHNGFETTVMLFIDRRPLKSVRARLNMLLGPERLPEFKYKVFYSKKLKLRLPLLAWPIFILNVITDLTIKNFSEESKYAYVMIAEGNSVLLGLFCRLMNIKYIKSLDNL